MLIAQPNVARNDTSYTTSTKFVATLKSRIRIDRISEDSLSRLFTNLLTERIIPHWLSTPWSFEGHTSIPRSGKIACGYFVSTTLLHMGFNLNRYKFAQQLPINEAKTQSLGSPLLEINIPSTTERIQQLQTHLKEGIYFIGFDRNHVGYIQKQNDQLLLIHSNYINAEGVVIEQVENSMVFASYQKLYIAEISRNQKLMDQWLRNERIDVMLQ